LTEGEDAGTVILSFLHMCHSSTLVAA
jgi:hypothetical protein